MGIILFCWSQANIASSAVSQSRILTKILQKKLAPASLEFAELDDLGQLSTGVFPGIHILKLVDKIVLLSLPAVRKEQNTLAGQPVASRPPRFLIIAFNCFGQIVVDDKTDVGFVDTHPESDRRNNGGYLVMDELLLGIPAKGTIQPGVVRKSG